MKNALLELITSKKFLAALTAVIVYLAGRFGFNVDTAILDRIYAALLVYIGAQGIADNGKSAAQISRAPAIATASSPDAGAVTSAGSAAGIASAALVILALGLGAMSGVSSGT